MFTACWLGHLLNRINNVLFAVLQLKNEHADISQGILSKMSVHFDLGDEIVIILC